ncbi:MAG: transglycosylase SLT domain-containing protein [Myxococcales bacterium]|nr:transglycosylase SLT domain-containing protein [Myxococcales bacterium]
MDNRYQRPDNPDGVPEQILRVTSCPKARIRIQALIVVFSVTALLCLVGDIHRQQAHAEANLDKALRSTDQEYIRLQLQPKLQTAGQSPLLPGSARPYVEARRALSKGNPTQALNHLQRSRHPLFADRETLVRGEALLALGQVEEAILSFEKALATAVLPKIAVAAVEGLALSHGRLQQYKIAHHYVDTLLNHGKRSRLNPRFLLAKAKLHLEEKEFQTAYNLTARIIQNYPASQTLASTRALQAHTLAQGAEPTTLTPSQLAKRAEVLVDVRQFSEASAITHQLGPTPQIKLLKARILAGQGQFAKAKPLFTELTATDVPDNIAGEALHYLARHLLDTDDNNSAQILFDQLVRQAPHSRRARNAEFYGGWIAHDEGRLADAASRMYRYVDRHQRARDRDEALWFAGWSNYLLKRYDRAKTDLQRLLAEHPKSNLVPQAYYWLGRIAEHQQQKQEAQVAYQRILKLTPFNYYAVWASQRLKAAGQPTPQAPAEDKPYLPDSLNSALRLLGSERPISIDRAILLFHEDRPGEVHQELSQALSQIGKVNDLMTARVAGLLNRLGAHHLAFRISKGLLGSGKGLLNGNATAWLAWRQAYPHAFSTYVNEAHNHHKVPMEIIWAIMRTETHYRTTATSRVGAGGVMQIMPKTAQRIGRIATGGKFRAARYLQPQHNIWLGTWYLGALLERFNGQLVPTAASYNAGPRVVDRWLEAFDGRPLDEFVERIPYRETRRYVRRVIETWFLYHQLYGHPSPTLPANVQKKFNSTSKANF